MKHLKLIFLLTMLFSVVYLHATPYSYNGINYILNDEDLTASVTSGSYYGSIVIPSIVNSKYTVTSIGKCAFIYNSNITSVTIPNSITTIEDDAFNGCSKLKSVNIPNSVTSIGLCAFSRCIYEA